MNQSPTPSLREGMGHPVLNTCPRERGHGTRRQATRWVVRRRVVRAIVRRRLEFSIGVIPVALESNRRLFLNEYLSLYHRYLQTDHHDDAIEVSIEGRPTFPWRGGPYRLRSPGASDFEIQRRFEVLPHLEWYINWQIIHGRHEYLQLHASSIETDGRALVMPGDPGSGKTTLTAGLLARGWSYLCDEFALIDAEAGVVCPYPRALCIKEAGFGIIDRLGLPLRRRTPYRKTAKGRVAFLNPLDVRADVVGRASPVRWIVFPAYRPDAEPRLERISRGRAAFQLARQCFNFQSYESEALTILAGVTRQAECYRLTIGDLEAACDLVEGRLLEGQALQEFAVSSPAS